MELQCASSQLPAALASTCSGTVSFTAGSGAATITRFTTAIVASTSVTYNPISLSHESITLWFVIGSTLFKVPGARGTAKVTIGAQAIPYIEFEFTGLFTVPAEGSRPTPTLTAWKKPSVASKTNTPVFTIGGTSLVMRQFAMDLGNQIETRFLINSESVMLVDRAETIDVTVEAEPLTTINPFQLAVNQTQTPVIVQHGVTECDALCQRVAAQVMAAHMRDVGRDFACHLAQLARVLERQDPRERDVEPHRQRPARDLQRLREAVEHPAHRLGALFAQHRQRRLQIHQVVEPVHQRAHAGRLLRLRMGVACGYVVFSVAHDH